MAGTKTCRQFPRAGRNSQGQGSQPILDTNRQNYQAPPLDPMGHCANPFGNAPSTMREDQRNCDATRISQWAANSVPMQGHAVSHWTSQGHYSTNPGNDISINSSVSPAPGSLASQFSSCVQQDPSCVGQMYQTPGHNGNPEMNTTSIGSNFTRIENNLNTFQGHGFDMVGQLPGEQYSDDFSVNNFSCPQSAVNGFSYTTPMDLHPPMVLGESNMAYPLPPEWSSQQMYGQPEENATATSFPLEYSPPLGLTPSVSSSNSLGSFPGPQPDTPVSMDILDQDWLSSQNVPHMGETTFYPQFSLGESRQIPAAANLMDEQRFVVHVDGTYIPPPDSNFSTVRPIGRSQRAPLPLGMMESQQLWSEQEDVAGQANEILSHPVSNGSRRSSEGGTAKEARSDPRYMATPSQDGLYHCPFESKEGCLHKPQKLKCNYDKHLDSHLKPYRCRFYDCTQIQFSSTACLLRHEREAHGMYGHGPKPHRCLYTDCERSQETNGFPRKWNLYDHMKRVHSYTGPEPSDRSDSPSPSDSSHDHETTADPVPTQRKRRSPKPADQGPPKRVRRAATRANARTTNSKNGSDVPLEEPQMERMPQQRHMPLLEQLFDEHSDRMQTPMMNQEYEILAPEALEQWPVDLAVYHELFNGINGQTLS